jgi:hypothetical protein
VGNQRKPTHKVLIKETHEPVVPQDWPDGHVTVALTPDAVEECIEVSIHGVKHYLHSTTARELSDRLLKRIEEWNAIARADGVAEV